MFIYTSRHDELFFVTVTAEDSDGKEATTITLRLTRDDANTLCRQLEHDLTDWDIEQDPHEKATLMAEYHEERAEIERDLAFADEPF